VLTQHGDCIGGYLFFKAKDYDEAVALAKDCPIFKMGGSIEVRAAMPM